MKQKKEICYGTSSHKKVVDIWFFYIKYIIPFLILIVFVSSFYDNFIK
ncbi:hypothetical protein GZ983_002715 [Campylobacter fetus]|nr:hypothetical protein GZ983_002715 [Campylobacter fetus]